jgi:hypothetical protein
MNHHTAVRKSAETGSASRARAIKSMPETGEIESRLNRLVVRVKDIPTALEPEWRAENPNACPPAQDLGVKTEAARWMLRVAKHLDGHTRERVLLAVLRSLEEIENIVDDHRRHGVPRVSVRESRPAAH